MLNNRKCRKRIKLLFLSMVLVFSLLINASAESLTTEQHLDSAIKKFTKDVNIKKAIKDITLSNYISWINQTIDYSANLIPYIDYKKEIQREKIRLVGECRKNSKDDVCSKKELEQIEADIAYLEKSAISDIKDLKTLINGTLRRCHISGVKNKSIYKDELFKKGIEKLYTSSSNYSKLQRNLSFLLEDQNFSKVIGEVNNELTKWQIISSSKNETPIVIVPKSAAENL